ncbi:MAG: tetratricopeptide repeat protein [Candidatus Caenarcaniphilales bacterium]|nr:tetratricopeptide repeat protein [Candidatus Caenarcaniphilales bacterium]
MFKFLTRSLQKKTFSVFTALLFCLIASASYSARISFGNFKNYNIPINLSKDEKLSEIKSQYVASNFVKGINEFKNKEFKRAIQSFTQCIKLKPNHHTSYMNRGLAKLQLGNFDSALEDFNKAISLNPKFSQAYKNRALLKFKHFKDLDGAIDDFDALLRLKPNYSIGYFDRATVKILNRDFRGAIDDLNKVIDLNPKFDKIVYVYWNQSQAYKKLGNLSQAKKYIDLAVESNSKLAGELIYQLSNNQIKNNKFDEAETNLSILIERNLNEKLAPKAYFQRGSIRYYEQNYNESVLDLSKAIELKPNYEEALVLRGLVFLRTNNYKSALKDFDKALSLKPNNKEINRYRTFALDKISRQEN